MKPCIYLFLLLLTTSLSETSQAKPLSCEFTDSCMESIGNDANEIELFADSCVRNSGRLVPGLCKMGNALGKCFVAKGKTTYVHYKINNRDNAQEVKNSCGLAKGTWYEWSLEEKTLERVKSLYKKRFETQRGQEEFERQVRALSNAIVIKDRKLTQLDKNWFGQDKISLLGHIMLPLNVLGGGCATLATFLCAQKLDSKITINEIDRAFSSKGWVPVPQRDKIFIDKGYYSLGADLLPNCEAYETMNAWLQRGCKIHVEMTTQDGLAHVEYLNSVRVLKKLNLCWGITNNWGNAAIIQGGMGSFYHSHAQGYNGNLTARFTRICPANEENLAGLSDAFISSLQNPDSASISAASLVSGIQLLLKNKTASEIVKMLKTNHINLDEAGGWVTSALYFAAQGGLFDVVRILIEAGADLNKENSGWTSLYAASAKGHTDVVRILIEAGADLNKANNGWTSLYVASSEGHIDVARILVEAGAEVNRANSGGETTPYRIALKNGHSQIARFLKYAGAHE